ncbi:hypothetical protein [Cupriavidus necator]|uniref:hypothetical protein n=1 Tax=Cupriavidus necator TaxID=106590 RepID=UPI0005B4D27E|nr:hypothetical protein [Cupriavidus necator]
MVQKLFHELPAGEQAAFEAACARHGFVREDFEVTVDEGIIPRGGPGQTSRKVTVARVSGSAMQSYLAGGGISWTAAFERDLEQDVFGFPLAD